jgi:hypothetical protein
MGPMNEKPKKPVTFDPDVMTEEELDEALERAGVTREMLGERSEQGFALANQVQAFELARDKGKKF